MSRPTMRFELQSHVRLYYTIYIPALIFPYKSFSVYPLEAFQPSKFLHVKVHHQWYEALHVT